MARTARLSASVYYLLSRCSSGAGGLKWFGCMVDVKVVAGLKAVLR